MERAVAVEGSTDRHSGQWGEKTEVRTLGDLFRVEQQDEVILIGK